MPDMGLIAARGREGHLQRVGTQSFNVTLDRPDGEKREIAVHVARSSWDGHPANIAMIQDISERKRAQDEIERYIRQLTDSIEGTLSSVSKMLDYRDP